LDGGIGDDTLFGESGDDVIDGGDGQDTIVGGYGADILNGNDGDDIIEASDPFAGVSNDGGTPTLEDISANILVGGNGDDVLYGSAGNDTLIGDNQDGTGDGWDYLYGRTGDDLLKGGLGGEWYEYNLGDGNDTIDDIGGVDDRLLINNPNGAIGINDLVFSQSGNNLLIDTDGTGNNVITILNYYVSTSGQQIENLIFDWDFENPVDLLSLVPINAAPDAKNDNIGGDEDTVLSGNVLADNGNGADSDPDNNILTVQAATFTTTLGGAVVLNTNGTFTYTPTANYNGADSFTYTVSDPSGLTDTATVNLTINPVNDAPFAQDDTIAAVYSGGAAITGNLFADNGNGEDSDIDGDTLSVVGSTATTTQGRTVTLAANGAFTYMPQEDYLGADSFTYTVSDGHGGTDTATVSLIISAPSGTILGTSGNDTAMNGAATNETMFGLAGNDTIKGFGGNDILYGGSGNDTVDGGFGNNILVGGTGADQIRVDTSSSGMNILYDRIAADTAVSDPFNDGTDTINGGNGADTLIVQAGYNNLWGNGGNDTYKIYLTGSINTINDASGDDTLIMPEISWDSLNWYFTYDVLNPGALWIVQTNGTTQIRITNQFSGYDASNNPLFAVDNFSFADGVNFDFRTYIVTEGTTAMETINGSAAKDYIITNSGGDTVNAGAESDYVRGGSGSDTINGDSGDDFLFGFTGDDTINGGDGADRIAGEEGADILNGNAGDDTVHGLSGTDTIHGNAGDDNLAGHSENDTVFGDEGTDTIDGGTGNDVMYGDGDGSETYAGGNDVMDGYDGNDTMYGGGGDDTMQGQKGDDTLYGGSGNDHLYGETQGGGSATGNDFLYGGDGNDDINGLNGNDLLSGQNGQDSLYGGVGSDTFLFEPSSAFNNIDTIGDFSLVQNDKIDISDLLQGYDPLQDSINDFVQITTSGSNSLLKVDVDGGANNFVQIATLSYVTGLNVLNMEQSGSLITV
jgi:Ca2+-binding RTX toxin-like protein